MWRIFNTCSAPYHLYCHRRAHLAAPNFACALGHISPNFRKIDGRQFLLIFAQCTRSLIWWQFCIHFIKVNSSFIVHQINESTLTFSIMDALIYNRFSVFILFYCLVYCFTIAHDSWANSQSAFYWLVIVTSLNADSTITHIDLFITLTKANKWNEWCLFSYEYLY